MADKDPEDDPHMPRDYDVVILESHSEFGSSPFSLGLFHPKTPPSLCRFIVDKIDNTDYTTGSRYLLREIYNRKMLPCCLPSKL
jgi:hypothetical protein